MAGTRRSSARVLIVEDSESIRAALASALRSAGHDVLERGNGDSLEHDLRAFSPDVVVLDIMLPGRDGFSLLARVRSLGDAGVLMLTARDAIDDRLRGLDGGADDYITKPFVLPEVVSRINALLRRMGRTQSVLSVGDLVVDPEAGLAHRAGTPLTLTATEFNLLCYFAENKGRVVTKTQILGAIWGFESSDPNLVEVFVSALRKKLEACGPRLLHTSRGLGYVMREEA